MMVFVSEKIYFFKRVLKLYKDLECLICIGKQFQSSLPLFENENRTFFVLGTLALLMMSPLVVERR